MAAAPLLPPLEPDAVLRAYFHAKDENRVHRLADAFSREARLEVRNNSGNIAFPAITTGRSEIGAVLVSAFGSSYENVYSFYLARPPERAQRFACGWLVAMSEKAGGRVRVGCGRYDWRFDAAQRGLADALVITIEAMELLAPDALEPTMEWVGRLDYPWSSRAQVLRAMPEDEALRPVREALGAMAD